MRGHVREERGAQERHVAGDDQRAVVRRRARSRCRCRRARRNRATRSRTTASPASPAPVGGRHDEDRVRDLRAATASCRSMIGAPPIVERALRDAAEARARPPVRMAAASGTATVSTISDVHPRGTISDARPMRMSDDARIGRVLVASLHQAIADVLPNRLEFYENWLNAPGLREGTIGLAPLSAVLSFLRLEGEAYNRITTRAGEYAADWTVSSMSGARAPRHRRAADAAADARCACAPRERSCGRPIPGSRVIVKVRRGTALVDLRGSLFCEVREASALPLCGFYAAAIARVLQHFALRGRRPGARVPRDQPRQGLPAEGGGPRRERRSSRPRQHDARSTHVRRPLVLAACPAVSRPLRRTGRSRRSAARSAGASGAAAARVLVVPFENAERRAALALAGRGGGGARDRRPEDARRRGAIVAGERVRAFEELHLPVSATLSRATVIKVGQLVGAARGRGRLVPRRRLDARRSRRAASGSTPAACSPRSPSAAQLTDLFASSIAWRRRLAPRRRRRRAAAARRRSARSRTTSRVCWRRVRSRRRSFLEAALRDAPAVRPRAAGALGSPRPSRATTPARSRSCAPCRRPRRSSFRARSSPAISLHRAEALRRSAGRCCKPLLEPRRGGPARDRRGAATTSACSCSAAARRRRPASPSYYLTKATDADPGPRLHVQPRLRLRARPQLSGRDLLAARGAAPRSRRRRRALSCSRSRCRRRAAPSRPRANAIWPRQLSSRYEELDRRRRRESHAGAAGPRADAARSRGVGALARRSDDRRTRRSASSASWRRSTSNRGGGCSSASRIARRSRSCAAPSTCRPTRRRRTC